MFRSSPDPIFEGYPPRRIEMASWGIRTFENDEATRWIAEFVESPEAASLLATLQAVGATHAVGAPSPQDPSASEALAAAEVVAAWCGRPAPEVPPQLTAWLLGRTDAVTREVLEEARRAVDSVLESDLLRAEWERSDEHHARRGAVEELRQRLGFD